MFRWLRKLMYKFLRKSAKPKMYANLYWCEIRDKNWELLMWKLLRKVKEDDRYTCYADPVTGKQYWNDVRDDEFVIHARLINEGKAMTLPDLKKIPTICTEANGSKMIQLYILLHLGIAITKY